MDLDEGFYGAIAAEMNRTHEWLIPIYNGHPWFEKPILIYWLAKPAILAFGLSWGPRLPSVLSSIGTLILVYFFVKKRQGERAAQLSILILSTCLFFAAVGRYLLCDPLLVFSLTGCFLAFWESLHSDPRYRILAASFLGLSVLAKGPVGCVLFVPLAIWVFWREKPIRSSFRGAWLTSIILFAVVVASWYLPAYLRAGHTFVQGFLIDQNLNRFGGGDAAHKVTGLLGIVYYPAVLLLGAMPWSISALRGWPRFKEAEREQSSLKRFLAAWLIIVVAFFTISGSKLPTYALPAFPPLAILAALFIAEKKGDLNPKRLTGYAIGSIGIGLFLTSGFYWYWQESGQAEAQKLASYVSTHAPRADVFIEYDMSGARPKSISFNPAVAAPGPIPVNRTSLPSLLMYAGRDCLFMDHEAQLKGLKTPGWIIARADNRLFTNPDPDLRSRLSIVQTGAKPRDFVLLHLAPPKGP